MSSIRTLAAVALCLVMGPALAADMVVTQRDKAFEPGAITVKTGQTVTFRNDDKVAHNVMSRTPGHDFNLKLQKPGEESEVTFDTPGTVEVRCAIHPRMKLTVNVAD